MKHRSTLGATLTAMRISSVHALAMAAACLLLITAGAQAQEGGGDLGDPSPGEGAELVPAPVPATPATDEGSATPTPEGYEGTAPITPPAGDVPPPPEEPPEDYGRDGTPSGRFPGGNRPVIDEGVRIPSRIATRLRVLDANFATLSSRGGSSLVDGILSIVTGGLAITLGLVVDSLAS